MRVIPIPVLQDNYSYLIIDDVKHEAAIVDPVEPGKIMPLVVQSGCKLTSILTTHHHADHSGGNAQMVALKNGLVVYGADARIPELNYVVKNGEEFNIGTLTVRPLLTPGHTKGSVSYYITDPQQPQKAVFTGDTLFVGGCGKFFEGTGEDMYLSLIEIIGSLPPDTLVYCGHEYTHTNLKFAHTVDPQNGHLQQKWIQINQHPGITVPSVLGEELLYNPFMRVMDPVIQAATGQTEPTRVMQALRDLKDRYRPT
ncbi:Cytoplasmic glyoxalase II [Dimargaris cristalligena]|uniref:hydroxyacylglutathione hydrolase n=1 Tax=Dimargaris cristalligena TaxID=215637 RepID=A0A4P9ZT72_9FUNG|nr:Cytoplasmic glyoxalase II [Dimargaris cristalligena]RKP36703.1 beta-lactamase-like protein [Dimargaris cristalligena]|eukprot:RKP36703.1 beta-lactamase-like protein [Dimargaris cristalligena]